MTSGFAQRRKARLGKPPPPDPMDGLTVRVAYRICAVVYGDNAGCGCKQRGTGQVCDGMKLAAQQAFAEIAGQTGG